MNYNIYNMNLNPTSKNECPPKGLDFREITDYRPSKQVYENIKDNNAYRLNLQRNAKKIMEENMKIYTTEACLETYKTK